ncbi:hypothetical protein E2320_016715 [Naja naja]|nr:hypothetical protein E2320_016715 [Naja naja]
MNLMHSIRESIAEQKFPQFVQNFMKTMYGNSSSYPQWAMEALASVEINLESGGEKLSSLSENGARALHIYKISFQGKLKYISHGPKQTTRYHISSLQLCCSEEIDLWRIKLCRQEKEVQAFES